MYLLMTLFDDKIYHLRTIVEYRVDYLKIKI